jgi:hypothetical protein
MGLFSNLKRTTGRVLKKLTSPISMTLKSVSKMGKDKSRVINKIPDEDKTTALVAEQVYNPPKSRSPVVSDFNLDYDFNGEKHCVYVNDKKNELVIGLRGTKPTDIEDLANDANIVMTDFFDERNIRFNKSYRIGDAEVLYNQVRKKYPAYKITVSGHSLAGRMTMELARNHRQKGINGNTSYVAYNAGGFPMPVSDYPTENTRIYLTGSDVLSWGWNRHPSSIIVDRKDKPIGNNHGIQYFI